MGEVFTFSKGATLTEMAKYGKEITERLLMAMKLFVATHDRINTMEKLCDLLGFHLSSVSRWKNKTGKATTDQIYHVCKKLGVSPRYVILNEGDVFDDDASNHASRLYLKKLKK